MRRLLTDRRTPHAYVIVRVRRVIRTGPSASGPVRSGGISTVHPRTPTAGGAAERALTRSQPRPDDLSQFDHVAFCQKKAKATENDSRPASSRPNPFLEEAMPDGRCTCEEGPT
jgi:hypothetical protein